MLNKKHKRSDDDKSDDNDFDFIKEKSSKNKKICKKDLDKELESIDLSFDSENKEISEKKNKTKKKEKKENEQKERLNEENSNNSDKNSDIENDSFLIKEEPKVLMNIKELKKEFQKKENEKKEKKEIKTKKTKKDYKNELQMKPNPKINLEFDDDGNPINNDIEKKIENKIDNNQQKNKNQIYPSAPKTLSNTNRYSLSILLPSSIVDNAQSKELRTYLIGQLARTIGIFKISEIIIYHDKLKKEGKDHLNFFVKNLQYLETPQYLRKTLFPQSEDLLKSGLMNPLESPHHLRIDEWCQYREGCILNRPTSGNYSWVDIGLKKNCKIDMKIPEKTRVTVKLNETGFNDKLKFYTGTPVSMREPYEMCGIYWGYVVRVAENFEEVFENSVYKEKYDLIIGTSDKGENYKTANYKQFKDFKHGLIVFGGIQGIEGMLEDDEHFNMKNKNYEIKNIFNLYLNSCLGQGLRTIRTEEAIMISLSVIRPELDKIKEVY